MDGTTATCRYCDKTLPIPRGERLPEGWVHLNLSLTRPLGQVGVYRNVEGDFCTVQHAQFFANGLAQPRSPEPVWKV
jgi:hypothetical protein